ncbi:MAG: AAA family ATPase, partial [Actinomycetota bacterium]
MSSGDAAPTTPLRPAVVGRDEELTRLTDFADAAVEHGARMVLLSGDAGIGKSTLTAHFLDQLRESGWGTHVGHCIEYADRPLPFGPVVAVLRSLLLDDLERVDDLVGHHREDLAGLVPELGDGDAGSASLAGDVDRLFDAIAALLTRASGGRPIAFLIEDVHWSDAATRDLLTSLVHNLRSARVLMLVTERTGALEKGNPLRTWLAEQRRFPNVHSMELEGLGEEDLAAQVASLTGEDADTSFVAELLQRTGGNPYFAHELVVAHGQQSGELPTSLREFLTARLSELGPDEREVLRAVAIAGGSVAHPVLAVMLADLDLAPLIRTLFDRGILVVDGAIYHLSHALMREAVLEDVLPFEAQELHRAAAEALEANLGAKPQLSDLVGLAAHWERVGEPEHTLRYAVDAAVAAARVAAFDTAGEMALQALESWELGGGARTAAEDRLEFLLRAIDWLSLSSRGAQALDAADEALGSWATLDEARARVESAASLVEFGLSRVSAAEARLYTALELVGEAETLPAAEVHLGAARLSLRLGDITTAMNSADTAARLTASDSDLHVEALNTLGLGLGVTSSMDEGLDLIDEARVLARTRSLPAEVARSYRNEMLVRLYREGRSPASVRALEEGLAYAEVHCGPQNRLRLKWDLATAYLESGDFGRAEPLVADLLASRADANARLWSLHTAAIHALGVGQLDIAGSHLAESADLIDP